MFLGHHNGQEIKPIINLAKLDLGLQGAGVSFEPKLFKNFTVDFCAGVGGGHDISSKEFTYAVLEPALYLSLTPKYFYNIKTRISKGKNTELNSGNYFGIRLKYVTPLSPQVVRKTLYLPMLFYQIFTGVFKEQLKVTGYLIPSLELVMQQILIVIAEQFIRHSISNLLM